MEGRSGRRRVRGAGGDDGGRGGHGLPLGPPAPLFILFRGYASFELASSSRKLPLTTRTQRDLFLSLGLVNDAELTTWPQLGIVLFPFTLFV